MIWCLEFRRVLFRSCTFMGKPDCNGEKHPVRPTIGYVTSVLTSHAKIFGIKIFRAGRERCEAICPATKLKTKINLTLLCNLIYITPARRTRKRPTNHRHQRILPPSPIDSPGDHSSEISVSAE